VIPDQYTSNRWSSVKELRVPYFWVSTVTTQISKQKTTVIHMYLFGLCLAYILYYIYVSKWVWAKLSPYSEGLQVALRSCWLNYWLLDRGHWFLQRSCLCATPPLILDYNAKKTGPLMNLVTFSTGHTGVIRKFHNGRTYKTLGQIDSVGQFLHHSWHSCFILGTHTSLLADKIKSNSDQPTHIPI